MFGFFIPPEGSWQFGKSYVEFPAFHKGLKVKIKIDFKNDNKNGKPTITTSKGKYPLAWDY